MLSDAVRPPYTGLTRQDQEKPGALGTISAKVRNELLPAKNEQINQGHFRQHLGSFWRYSSHALCSGLTSSCHCPIFFTFHGQGKRWCSTFML